MPIFFKMQTAPIEEQIYNFRKEVLSNYSKSKSIKDIDEKFSLSPLLSKIMCIAIYNSETEDKLLFDGEEKNILSLFTKYLIDHPNITMVSFNGTSFDLNYILIRLLLNSPFEKNNISIIENIQKRLKWHLDIFQILKNTLYGDTSFPTLYKIKFGVDLKYSWMSLTDFNNSSLSQKMTYDEFLKRGAKEYVVALYEYCCLPENSNVEIKREMGDKQEILQEVDSTNIKEDKEDKDIKY